jgi:hypothetical protein
VARAAKSWPLISSTSKALRKTCRSARRLRSFSNTGTPLSSQATASPLQEERAHLQRAGGLGDERGTLRPVDAVTGQQPDGGRIASGHEAEAVELDLVNPAEAARRGRQAGLDKAGRRPAHTQKGENRYRASARESNPGGDHADMGRALTAR